MMYPVGWDDGPVIIYHHGAGENHTGPQADPLKTDIMAGLMINGFAIASIDTGFSAGNPESVDWYNQLYAHLVTTYEPSSVAALSQSLGGISGLNSIIDGTIPYTHWAGIYPACDLAATYTDSGLQAVIDFAYGINGTPYATATDGSDPILEADTAFTSLKTRFYASADDEIVDKAANSDAFAAHIADVATSATVVTCFGGHGHRSHFKPQDLVTFYTS
jgi:hypothetical protein